jgi:hypothetical protein
MTDDDIIPIETPETLDRVRTQLSDIDRAGRGVSSSLSRAFLDLAVKGKSFEDVLKNLALRLSNIALNAAFKPLEQSLSQGFSSIFSGSSGGSGFVSDSVSGGGFSPFTSIAQAPRGEAPITVNIQTADVESFKRSETQVAAVLARSVARGQRNF